jgi:hypothetical protein
MGSCKAGTGLSLTEKTTALSALAGPLKTYRLFCTSLVRHFLPPLML